ncbi:hydantoinase [Rhodospirillales bacterium TMPK1]|uniref:Hydantoinase n=2 Tax=Roseiterribacter gracilis TaxID=2812848 RepID=A0A8S8XEP3_9PROT|nr:hydantoinase [Rhodospirillales bacterium TMPK1]
MKIGVDVGGTNTDAVLTDGRQVIAGVKAPTTTDVSSGIVQALQQLLGRAKVGTEAIDTVVIGTTHFTNAFVQGKGLGEVAVVRLGAPSTLALPPLCGWPERLTKCIGDYRQVVGGGHDFDGRPYAPLDERALRTVAKEIRDRGLRAAAISSVFSPVNQSFEERAAEILRDENPDLQITLSHAIGRIGLLERENAAVMNASLAEMSRHVVASFRAALDKLGITVPFYISQNDGTILDADRVAQFPVLTFASGPTNSMRGAALLSGLANSIVVDIGGTTSDVGVISNGYPRESAVAADIGGVRTNFRMPDILSLGLGGGSLVTDDAIGPRSVGHMLQQDALVFGGSTLTTTDIAVAAGQVDIGDKSLVKHLDKAMVARAIDRIHEMLDVAIDRMKTSSAPVPVVLVGGGTVLVSRKLRSASEIVIPENAGVANAMGAALAQVGGEVDQVMSYRGRKREDVLAEASDLARKRAVDAGAIASTIAIVDVEELPLAYVPGEAVRVRIKAVGDLAPQNPKGGKRKAEHAA